MITASIESARSLARRLLPDAVRKPLGSFCGRAYHAVVEPIFGVLFDLLKGRYRTGGCEFIIPRDLTSAQFRASFFLDSYEAEERRLIAAHVRPGDAVLEYGACLGIVSCTTSKLIGPAARHVVVEGNPLLVSHIARNRVLNGCAFVIENGAASASPDYCSFFVHPVYVVGGSTDRVGEVSFRVAGLPLAELHRRHGGFDVLVLDVEGAERELLRAGGAELSGYRAVILELHPYAYGETGAQECRDILARAGFACRGVAGHTEAWLRDTTPGSP